MDRKPTYEELEQRVNELEQESVMRKQAEDALRENEKKYRSLVDNYNHPLNVYDTELNLIIMNHVAAEGLGGEPQDFIGKKLNEYFPDKAEEMMERHRKIIESGKPADFEERFELPSGEMWTWTNLHPLFDKNGNVYALQSISYDITERKQAEEALKESERKLRAIFDQTFQFTGLMTIDGTLIEANRTALNFAGIEAKDVLGKPFWETTWWTHSAELQERLKEAVNKVADGHHVRLEAFHPATDGGIHAIDFSLKPVKDEAGNVIFMIPEGHDITERKRAEEALRESKELYRNIFESISDGILALDCDFHYTHWNRAFESISKTPREQVVGVKKKPWELFPHLAEQGVDEMMKRSMRGEIVKRENIPYRLRDGTEGFTSEIFLPLKNPDGEIRGIVGVVRDVTERKKSEEERERLIGELKNALDNIKVLKGLLPICAQCKKVRDDKGYWNQIEKYIETHTDALFSHGLCPGCMDKLYGGEDWYKKKDSDS